jgi:hypothetical protein
MHKSFISHLNTAVNYSLIRRLALKIGGICLLFVSILGLASCYRHASPTAMAQPEPVVKAPPVQVFFYPKMGQTSAQQDRDRFECYHWAVKQTGFDPVLPSIEPRYRVTVVPVPPPGHDTFIGAVSGAAVGAMAAGPHRTAEGALIGAAAGALAGAVSDTARQEQAKQVEETYTKQDRAHRVQIERQAQEFRRAMAACLEGRGYSAQ